MRACHGWWLGAGLLLAVGLVAVAVLRPGPQRMEPEPGAPLQQDVPRRAAPAVVAAGPVATRQPAGPAGAGAAQLDSGSQAAVAAVRVEPFWERLDRALVASLAGEARTAFQPGRPGGVEEALRQVCATHGPPEALAPVPWMAGRQPGLLRGVLVAEGARLFPDSWQSWARAVLVASARSAGAEIGILWAAMASAEGAVDLAAFRVHLPHYQFLLTERLGACRLDWVRRLAHDILSQPPRHAGREEWTRRSLAALAVAPGYESDAGVRALLAPALLQREPLDPQAHPGAVLGLAYFGGDEAAAALEYLLELPGYAGLDLLIVCGGRLLDRPGQPSLALRVLQRVAPADRAAALPMTMGALYVLSADPSRDEALLDELLQRARNPRDQAVDRPALIQGLLAAGLDPHAGAELVRTLCRQDARHTLFLLDVAQALPLGHEGRAARADFLSFLDELQQLHGRDAQATRRIGRARRLVAHRVPP